MKVYKLKSDTPFTLNGESYLFKKLDGMYAICTDGYGKTSYIPAWEDVEVIDGPD